MTTESRQELRFQSGGTLRKDAFYVVRSADHELTEALLARELCYVLAPRQIGKSSLRVRTAQKLSLKGVRCISIDLNLAGTQETSPEAWYYSLAQEISLQLKLPGDPWDFWQKQGGASVSYRLGLLLRQSVQQHIKEPVVIFIDEIDSVLALPFPFDAFFTMIRSLYNDRAEDESLQRLTFCLLGVAAPADLIQNPVLTPFNVGRGIVLEDLTPTEAQALLPGLERAKGDPLKHLHAILSWTDGHPYMTQRLCEAVINAKDSGPEVERVGRIVEQIFLSTGRDRDPNLAYAEKRLEKNPMLSAILRLYARLLNGQSIPHEREDPVQAEMRLSGLVARRTIDGRSVMQIRNRIFATIFNQSWLTSKLQSAERRIVEPLQRWHASGKQPDFLLRGDALRQMMTWSTDRRDLTEEEYEFLLAGLEQENQGEQRLREDAERQRQAEEDRRKAAETQRQAEEDRRKAIEARRQAEQEQQQALEEQRRAERARQQADHERERIRATSRARRQIILLLTGALVLLSAILAALAWQTQVASKASRDALKGQRDAENSEKMLQKAVLERKGQVAAYEASQPGRQAKALSEALEAVEPSLRSNTPPPTSIAEGLSMATGVGVYAYRLPKHTNDWVRASAFSPKGDYLVTTGNDGRVHFWDGNTYCRKGVLTAHRDQIRSVVFSHDGTRILTAGGDGSAKIWDVTMPERKLLFELKGHTAGLRYATFSPDDKTVITASDDGTARVWSATTGKPVRLLDGHPVDRFVIYESTGKYFATAGEDARHVPADINKAWLWDAKSYKVRGFLEGHVGPLRAIAYSPDGKTIATSGLDTTARLWDAKTRRATAILSAHTEPVRAVAFSPDGRYLVTAGDDKTARIWDVQSGVPVLTLSGHTESVRSAIYSPDGTRVVTASVDRSVRIWYVSTGKALVTLAGHRQWVSTASYDPSGTNIITASEDRTVRIWDAVTGVQKTDLKFVGHMGDIRSAMYSRDGKRIVTASHDRTARIWDAATAKELFTLSGHTDYVQFADFSPDGSLVATSSSDRTAAIWNAQTGARLHVLRGHTKLLHILNFSPDGKRLATTSGDKTVRIWDVTNGQPLSVLTGPQDEVFSARYSPDGKRLVTSSFDNKAYVWDANAQTGVPPLFELRGHEGGVWSAEYSPDGARILTASNDQTARIWNATSGELLMTLAGHAGGLTYASFLPRVGDSSTNSSDRVVTAGRDRIAVVHPADIRDYFRIACNLWWSNRVDITSNEQNDRLNLLCEKEIGKWPQDEHLRNAGKCAAEAQK